jgi:glycosyltransferase involved in cell wall biosynthesis
LSSGPEVTVIIPTTCSAERHESLLRAVASAHAACSMPIVVLVVVNGAQVDALALAALTEQLVQVERLQEGSLPKALARGRALVSTAFFGFLDDDDELLPGALDRRLELMRADPALGLVVSNGWRQMSESRRPSVRSLQGVDKEPLRRLLYNNWLASCAGLYRSSMVTESFFDKPHGFGEWTWLAYRLCLAGVRVGTVHQHDFLIHDTPGSLSKTAAYHRSYLALFDRMLVERPPAWARREILAKRSATLHDLAVRSLEEGRVGEALDLHLRSLGNLRGLRYIGFTRRILARAMGLP